MPLKPDQCPTNLCNECGAPTNKPKPIKFCDRTCAKAFNNRRMTRGARIYDLAMIYRKDRKAGALGDLCHQLSLYIQADTEEGRTSFNRFEDEPIPYDIPTIKRKI